MPGQEPLQSADLLQQPHNEQGRIAVIRRSKASSTRSLRLASGQSTTLVFILMTTIRSSTCKEDDEGLTQLMPLPSDMSRSIFFRLECTTRASSCSRSRLSCVHLDALCVMQQVISTPEPADPFVCSTGAQTPAMGGVVLLLLRDLVLIPCFDITSTKKAMKIVPGTSIPGNLT